MAGTTASKEFTVGRYGLRVPTFEPVGAHVKVADVFSFFHRLWEQNGFVVYDQGGIPKEFNHELVVPASKGKPVTLIAGSFSRVSKIDQAANAFENAVLDSDEDRLWNAARVITAREAHSAKITPMHHLGSPAVVLSAEYAHRDELMPYTAEEARSIYDNVGGTNRSEYSLDAYGRAPAGTAYQDAEVEGQVMERLVMDTMKLLYY